ncbi:MAG TPA: hypothetical protein VFQ45_09345 [Longimicrobium sp.]|nr:hypothetical protein [Longimicrobium sp.]
MRTPRARVLSLLLLALAACTPRPAPAPAPPPAPPPPAAAELDPELERIAREERARVLFGEGVALGRQGRWTDAADRYRRAAELHADSVTYHMALADALLNAGREWEAADALQAGIRVEEARPAPNHRVLAVDYERLLRLLTRLNRVDEARTARARMEHHRRMRDAESP